MAKPSISTPCIILYLFIILATALPSYSNSNHTDYEALLSFKKAIDGDPLGALSSWNETTHFCRWNGVSCGKRHPNRVVSVSLRSQGLVGSLSPHIGNLSFLRTIILQNNSFRGPIPQEMGRLRRLQVIEFSNNSFGGGIPTNLSHCRNLYWLNLIDNELTGSIVPEIASLVNLQTLALSKNTFSGSIPPFLGNLTNLLQLSLNECGLQGEIPESLVQLRRMRGLFMSGNSLTGSIPFGLFNLSTMEAFTVRSNQLHGTIHSSFTLPNLWFLDLSSNHFTGSIPFGLFNLSTMEKFSVRSNQLHGTIPSSFTLPNLSFLDLAMNHFTGPLPPSLSNSSLIQILAVDSNNFTGEMIDLTGLSALEKLVAESNHLKGDIHTILSSLTNLTRLQGLGLFNNLFSGSLPDSIGNLSTHLSILDIGVNQISGSIPSTIGNLIGLTALAAEANNLQGPIPSSIGKLYKLQRIYLQGNELTNEIPLSFGNLTLLNELKLRQNNLFGRIPQSLAKCTNLQTLDLSDNHFNGSIPPEILRLSSLSIRLDLSSNNLMGTIPSEVGALRNLGALGLSNNRLSGSIPTSLSSCVMLDTLYLDNNSLQGEIPDSLRALRGLQYLDLSHNNFSGKIPIYLAQFRLLYLNLSFNAMEGEVPTLGVFQNESAFSLQGNHHLCGGMPILNLPSCSLPNSNKKLDLGKILIPTAGAICLALSLLCFCVIIYRRRTLQKAGTPAATFMVPEFLRLSYADLLNATGGFSESNLVGAGRFGSVYKGTIINDDDVENTDVAVKVLNLNIRGAFKSLASECNALRGIRHKNLLKIMSVCNSIDFQENDFKALVYEFMANGSLENWLHHNSEEQGRILSIIQRLDIAIEIASGVEYLHGGTDFVVIHGDLKPSNILLDQDMVAHVGDFGLAKIISSISQNLTLAEGSSSSAIKGTIGYIPPEYGMNDVVSTQGDAYSYGILVLEMFTNIRPTSDAFEGYVNLQDFVSSALTDRVMEVVDPCLHQQLNEGDKYLDCIVSILKIGVRCSMELPRDRMSMAEVVNELKKIKSSVFLEDRSGRK